MSRALDEALDRLAQACANLTIEERVAQDHPLTPNSVVSSGSGLPVEAGTETAVPTPSTPTRPIWTQPLPRRDPRTNTEPDAPDPKIIRPVRPTPAAETPTERVGLWQRITSATSRAFHRYTRW